MELDWIGSLDYPRRQRLENELMLVLLKAGCPSGDVLSAQMRGISHLAALAEQVGETEDDFHPF